MGSLGGASCTVHLISAPSQAGSKWMYHYIREAKSLLSWYVLCILWLEVSSFLLNSMVVITVLAQANAIFWIRRDKKGGLKCLGWMFLNSQIITGYFYIRIMHNFVISTKIQKTDCLFDIFVLYMTSCVLDKRCRKHRS